MKLGFLAGALLVFVVLIVGGSGLYTVHQTETVILTQFGRPVGEPITEPGLHWKTPFVQDVNRLEKRVLPFDANATSMTTKDKTYIQIDTFGRWRIADPAVYFVKLRDERSALSRIEDIVGSEVRSAVARHELIEVIRSDKDREVPADIAGQGGVTIALREATRGRLAVLQDVLEASGPKLQPLGIELLDVRLKRVNYNERVLPNIYQRMKSEREQIAQRFRSEGEGERARILGKKERDLLDIQSTAYKRYQQLRGEGDAEATRIYAEAYDKSPAAREFYKFLKTTETYRSVLGGANLVLSTDSELFELFKRMK
ncbi:MAG: protease modulator HflC [Planctomycetes bacterium]|nr:protease modulator HflC [Planctomycetota bacterium]